MSDYDAEIAHLTRMLEMLAEVLMDAPELSADTKAKAERVYKQV